MRVDEGSKLLRPISVVNEVTEARRGRREHEHALTVEPGKMGGKPCIRGLRFTVYDVASYLASGMSEDEILKDFPYLEKEDFQAVYEFFASIPERISVLEASR